MKVLTYEQFLATDRPVIYATIDPKTGEMSNDLCLKYKTVGKGWEYTSLSPDLSVGTDYNKLATNSDLVKECIASGEDVPMNFDDNGRREDGSFQDQCLFGVFTEDEVKSMVSVLRAAADLPG
jgi:hypothetical protein